MAMGTRKDQEQQEELWIPQAWLAKGVSHPFYQRLNQLLEECRFDEFVEGRCRRVYSGEGGGARLAAGGGVPPAAVRGFVGGGSGGGGGRRGGGVPAARAVPRGGREGVW